MKKLLFFSSLIGIILFWDLVIRTIAAFSFPAARRVVNRKAADIACSFIAVARVYMGSRVQRRIHMPAHLPEVFLVICNHQSIIDIAFLYYYFQDYSIRFAAKHELLRGIPLISQVLRFQKHAEIRRDGKIAETMRELEKLARSSRRGICPVVFPEGTRSRTGEVLPFHAGAVRKILETVKLPVLTVAIDGGYQVAATKDLSKNLSRINYRFRALKLSPPPQTKREINGLLKESEDLVRRQIEAWRS